MNIAMTNEEGGTVPLPSQSHDLPSQSHDLLFKSHDLPSQSHDLEQLSEDMLHYMQVEQVSPEQYCHSVIATVTLLLLGYLSKHIPQLKEEAESSEPGSNRRPLSLYIAICLQLLAAVVNLLEQVKRHTRTPELSQMNNTLVRTHTHTHEHKHVNKNTNSTLCVYMLQISSVNKAQALYCLLTCSYVHPPPPRLCKVSSPSLLCCLIVSQSGGGLAPPLSPPILSFN